MLALLLFASCTAPQVSFPSTTIPPAAISTPSIDTPTLPLSPPTRSQSEPTLTQPIVPEVHAWLRENAIAFDTTDPNSDVEDLLFLKEWIGDARIVALGEATHGTHEFFQMKHRMLKFLVEEMGFNIFAIEANWPEANLVNTYVHTGQGDPAELLRGLYFWTWNTREVLDMILWMRAHNENPGDAPSVSFLGFDMQFYEIAMDNVVAYLEQVDPARALQTRELYRCLRRYAPRENIYADLPFKSKADCGRNLHTVYAELSQHQSDYEAQSSPEAFAQALQNSRIVLQAEKYMSLGQHRYMVRDRYMAENITWLLDQAGPDAKIVLWAHNGHVGTYDSNFKTMGQYLRESYGEQMVVFGFSFYEGSFNTTLASETGERVGMPTKFEVTSPPEDSYETYFHSTGLPRFFLDLRDIAADSQSGDWLLAPHPSRNIAELYRPSNPDYNFIHTALPDLFDVIIYFQHTSASVLLER